MSGIVENGVWSEAAIGGFKVVIRICPTTPDSPSKFGQKGKKAAGLGNHHPGRTYRSRLVYAQYADRAGCAVIPLKATRVSHRR